MALIRQKFPSIYDAAKLALKHKIDEIITRLNNVTLPPNSSELMQYKTELKIYLKELAENPKLLELPKSSKFFRMLPKITMAGFFSGTVHVEVGLQKL